MGIFVEVEIPDYPEKPVLSEMNLKITNVESISEETGPQTGNICYDRDSM